VITMTGKGTGTGTATGSAAEPDATIVVKAKPPVDAAVAVIAIDAEALPTDMVHFAGGTFEMGDDPRDAKKFPGAQAKHSVTVAPFWLDKTEATRPDGMLPATGLSWAEADAACKRIGKRLPTEAEWELAARAAPLDPRRANLKDAHKDGPTAVGTMPGDCSPEGVCDLLGNVMEWTADKVVRGASFTTAAGGWYGTVQARLVTDGAGDKEIGFRCAK